MNRGAPCAFVAGGLLLCSIPPEHFANELFQGENALARNAGLIFLINIPLEKCKIFLVFVNIFTLPRAAMPRIDVSGALAYILRNEFRVMENGTRAFSGGHSGPQQFFRVRRDIRP